MKKILFVLAAAVLVTAGCSTLYDSDGDYSSPGTSDYISGSGEADKGDDSGQETPKPVNGVLTAGEWKDLDNWQFWGNLLNKKEWSDYESYWKFYTHNMVYVKLSDSAGNPSVGVDVTLSDGNGVVWSAVSDNKGIAVLWADLYAGDKTSGTIEGYEVKVAGKVMDGPIAVTTLSSTELAINEYEVAKPTVQDAIDVAFIVDATGSMGDEINFLREDLMKIVEFVGKQVTAKLRTGVVFYRDEGDEFLTIRNKFTEKVDETVKYIGEKGLANGGGDYPEAVHSALECGLQNLDWNTEARSRVAFLILDAPPHHNDEVITDLQHHIAKYAEMGIHIIPVAASGIDKSTEHLLRSFALATNATYVFLTNDSGVGDSHIEASVGEYKVEKLLDLIVRLIVEYAQ